MKIKIYHSPVIYLALGIVFFASCNNASKFKPQNDFYEYVNHTWLKNNPVPPTEGVWGSFYILRDSNDHYVRRILEECASHPGEPGSVEQKIGDYYATAIDSVTMNKQGLSPLKDELDRISAISDYKSLWGEVARLMKMGPDVMYSFDVEPDSKISNKEAVSVGQGGMSLPNKEYYLKDNPRMKMIRDKFMDYGTQIFSQMNGNATASSKDIKTIMDIETEMAKGAYSPVELRNVHRNYNKMTLSKLKELSPHIDWNICLDTFGLKDVDTVILGQVPFITHLDSLIPKVSLDNWKTYLKFHLVTSKASMLGDSMVNISFNFRKIFTGQKEMQPRWKRAVQATNGALGMLIGQLYVKKYFSPESKEKVLSMVHNIIDAYKERINNLPWMDPKTKTYALEKLDKVMLKLCYPDKWKDFSDLQIKRDAFVLNSIRADEFEFNYDMKKYGKPVDRSEWGMSPQTVNAYYEPTMNEIVFPAAIMQPPFFDPNGDTASNYGGIGAVIGHEMTHGFDDQGSQYDAEGNMRKWWTNDDSVRYFKRLQVLINQFNGYEIDSMHVNGNLTLGENTADLGGITIAFQALENELKKHPEGMKDGYTPEQRFFVSFARIWRTNYTPQAIKNQIENNPHSPAMFRANGPLSDMLPFYKAFDVKPGDGMYRDSAERAAIW